MPWTIKMQGEKHCVYKKGSDGKPTGKSLGCHDSHEKAEKQRKALYASEAMSAPMHIIHVFSEQDKKSLKAGEPVWIHAAPYGDTLHPVYGEVVLDDTKFERFIENFNSNVVGHDLPVRYEHFGMDSSKGFKAAGWIKDVKIEDDGLWYFVEFTNEAAEEINDGAWRYFSFEFDDLFEDNSNHLHLDVLRGGGLTNDPYWGNMVPLNFSTLATEHPGIFDEHADLEHSEPGTGSPPERRTDGDIQDDELHRREQVPPAFEEPEDSHIEEEKMEELLKKLRKELGLPEDAKEDEVLTAFSNVKGFSGTLAKTLGMDENSKPEDIIEAAKSMHEEIKPLRDADEEASKRKAFRDAFPEEHKRMQRLEQSDRENKAKAFSGNYARFAIVENGKVKEGERSTRGFSALVLNEIEDAHKALAAGEFSVSAFSSLLDHIANNGIVDYKEAGSSLSAEGREVDTKDDPNTRYAFSRLVQEIIEEDELSRPDAIREAARREPELYEEYRNPHARRAD